MAFEFLSTNKLSNVARAIYDLRVGMPVIIDSHYLVFACETIDKTTFQNISEDEVFINAMLVDGKTAMVRLPKGTDFSDLLITQKFEKEKPIRAPISPASKLLKIAELIPTYLMLQINKPVNNITSISCQDIDVYIQHMNNQVSCIAETELKLKDIKQAKILSFRSEFALYDHYAIVIGDLDDIEIPNVRVHSTCFTGDLLKSLSCDCHDQLTMALEYMNNDHPGIILYLMQEGRGIGLTNKIRAYKLQSLGYDTLEANEKLGFNRDERDFGLAAAILKNMGIGKINLLTNNPEKVSFLQNNGIQVVKTTSAACNINAHNKIYLETKKSKMGHKILSHS